MLTPQGQEGDGVATSQMLFSRSKAVGGPQATGDVEGNVGGQGPFGGARLTLCVVRVLEVCGIAKVNSFVPCSSLLLCLPSPGACSGLLILRLSETPGLVPGIEERSMGDN